MSFVNSGAAALSVLDEQEHDVVISDLRMPGMDGAALLAAVRESHPVAVRIVLSGQAELRTVARAAGVAHRLLAKPCEVDELTRVIERSCALREITDRVELNRRIAGASALPSVPGLYVELTDVLRSGEGSADDAARIVERDIAMAAKVLHQLANSAHFGRHKPARGVREAVTYLRLEALRALVLSAETFREFPVSPPIPGFDLEVLELHCSRVAQLARSICPQPDAADEASAAGLLHDVGLLVMASHERDALAETITTAQRERRPLHEVERERHGVTHAEVGAHLLALWGLPHPVAEAVARHHDEPSPGAPLDTMVQTYIANALVEELESASGPDGTPVSHARDGYLSAPARVSEVAAWRELAKRQFQGDP
jgi:putative nucleotidyltransferase with HDIG domain